MAKRVIFLIVPALFNGVFGQNNTQNGNDTLNRTDESGFKQGYWKRYKEADGNQFLAEEGKYINNKKTGVWTEYYGNGKRKNSLEFKDGRANGKAFMYYDNGWVSESGTWKSNKWVGQYNLYFEHNGEIQNKFNFNAEGKREGLQQIFYSNGKLYIEGTFKDGKEDSLFTFYNFLGKLVGKKYFKNGIETEESKNKNKFDYERLKTQSDSLNGTNKAKREPDKSLSGYQELYNRNRQKTKEGVFKDNRLIDGKAYIYDEEGKLARITIYKDGLYIEDEFNANMTPEEKAQKELLDKLKNMDSELLTMKALVSEKQKEVEKKDNQLKEQTLQNQVLEKEKQIKELLLLQQNNTLKTKEAEALKKELEIATLNKDKKIKDIEIKSQKAENDRKEQELKLGAEQKKFQEAELKQQKFTKNLISFGLVAVAFFSIFIFISLQKNKKANKIISHQKREVEQQKHLVEEKHKEITDSINYAERIQRSFLATKQLLDDNLQDYFVFFQPKDVVSGDFYWATKLKNNNFLLATADSTGHGVPGAIMSILNISSIEKAVEQNLTEPAEIFNHTRSTIIERLKKDGSEHGGKDGMDCSLISFDFSNNKLTYSAANNPVWIVRENKIIELASDKMPVGKGERDSVLFTQHTIELQKGDVIYTLTDGMPDQFGGPKGKKYMYKQLKEVLISISNLSMQEQRDTLKNSLNNWKGNLEQVDDVCLIGVRV